MKNRRLLLFVAIMALAILMSAGPALNTSAAPSVQPRCPTKPQQGELVLTVPAGETTATHEQPFTRCAGQNIQVTGGTTNRTALIINAAAHHDRLLVTAHLLTAQTGPTDVTAWWRVD